MDGDMVIGGVGREKSGVERLGVGGRGGEER